MALEATKMAIRGNIHINAMVLEVAHFRSEVKFDLRSLRPFGGHLGLRGLLN